MSRNYKELIVWQKAVELSISAYRATELFPKSEQYGLTSQIRRSVVSIASNIAEGSERQSDRDFVRFLNFSGGSLAEFETQTLIASRLGYLSENHMQDLSDKADEIGRMLRGLSKKLATSDLRLETRHA